MRKWLGRFVWSLIGLFFLSVGGGALGGYLLPRQQQATASVTVKGSPSRVWQVLNDHEKLPLWFKDVYEVKMEKAEDGRMVAWWCDKAGRKHLGWVTKAEVKERSLVRETYDPAKGLGWSGVWTYTLAPAGAGQVQVTLTEQADFPTGLQRMLAAKVLKRSTKLQQYLDALQAELAKP